MRGAHNSAGISFLVLCATLALGAADSPAPAVPTLTSAAQPAAIIGFVGGHVKANARAHSTVQLADRLRQAFPASIYVKVFENRDGDQAYSDLLHHLDLDKDGTLSSDEKQHARVVIYGHSWGASETVTLARKLQKDQIPVLLTIQVDSVAKHGENDALIPANVAEAANFYQPHGLVHGRARIRAADPGHTQILGNFRFDYSEKPITCGGYPWFNAFIRPHIEIECDPKVWDQVQSLIQSRLIPEAQISVGPIHEH